MSHNKSKQIFFAPNSISKPPAFPKEFGLETYGRVSRRVEVIGGRQQFFTTESVRVRDQYRKDFRQRSKCRSSLSIIRAESPKKFPELASSLPLCKIARSDL